MNKTMILAALAATTLISSPALAAGPDGHWQFKLLGTGVLPDGKITELRNNTIGLPTGSQTAANDKFVPTLAVEYFLNKSWSIETICCVTNHKVNGAGAIAGTEIVDHAMILPATVTVKWHLDAGGIKPYLGAGPALFFFIDERQGSTLNTLNPGGSLTMENQMGGVLQAGVDIPVNDKGLGISLDAKKYFVNTVLHVRNAAGTEILQTKHDLSPWVVSGGVSYRF